MRFAIKTAPMNTTWGAMLDVWKAADDIDVYESAWTFDHFEPIFSDRSGPCLEGWITLAALAQATSRLRIGVLVTGMPYRHPSVLANMAATLDVVSDGRLELGLGAGWNQEESDALGIELPPLKERFDRFDEGLEVVKLLLSEEVADYDGTYFTLRQARCEPKPVQRPHPPIVIGGTGPKRTLRAVARHADHWNHPGASPEDWRRTLEVLHERCAEIDRDPSTITTSTHVRVDWSDPGAATAECARWAEAGLDLAILYLPTPHTPDRLEPVAEALRELCLIDDPGDPRLADYVDLRAGRPDGVGPVIVEGLLAVEQLVASPFDMRSVLVTPAKRERLPPLPDDVPVLVAEPAVLRATVGFDLHRGVVASADRPPPIEASELVGSARRIVIVERVNDLENLGSLFRAARAFGCDAVLLDPETADPLGRRPVRVSMGHVLHVPFARLDPWPDALGLVRDAGLTIVALTPSGGAFDLPDRVALLVGAEGPGLSDAALAAADRRVRIDMAPGVDSLNVATAAAIALHAHYATDG